MYVNKGYRCLMFCSFKFFVGLFFFLCKRKINQIKINVLDICPDFHDNSLQEAIQGWPLDLRKYIVYSLYTQISL